MAETLQKTYNNAGSAIKKIGRDTGMSLSSIGKWYQGKYPPKSAHLLQLASMYPELLNGILLLIGKGDLIPSDTAGTSRANIVDVTTSSHIYRVKYVPINVSANNHIAMKLNQRQLWFVSKLQQGERTKASDIAFYWGVSEKTAKRDIARLQNYDMIRFYGARKNGYYVIT